MFDPNKPSKLISEPPQPLPQRREYPQQDQGYQHPSNTDHYNTDSAPYNQHYDGAPPSNYGTYSTQDNFEKQEFRGEEEDLWNNQEQKQLSPDDRIGKSQISPLQAAWNVTNAIQGMFIVSLPYAVLHGGWWGVMALAGVAGICYYTGLILVECLYDEEGKRVRGTYREVAEECWGRPWGGRILLFAQLTELLMTCILYVVLTGDLMENSFPDASMDKVGWMILSGCILLPCSFLTDLRSVSTLSFWNAVSHVFINVIILFYCLSQIGSWELGRVGFTINIHTFPTVLGIIVFSYTSHIFLPSLEGSLTDRTMFKPMLKWSHIAAAIFKSVFGLIGFLTFSVYTQEEVTNNLPSQEFKVCVNLILVVKALLSYPLPYFAAAQIIESEFLRGKPYTRLPNAYCADGALKEWGVGFRVALVVFTLFLALSTPYFALLMGLVGNITGTMLSFIWPCLFHLKIKANIITPRTRLINISIVSVGVLFGTIGIYYSSKQLSNAVNREDEYG